LGLEKSRTAFDVWLEKKGREFLVSGTPFFARVLDPVIAEFYERDHDSELTDSSEKVFVHPSMPFIAAQPAWLVEQQRIGLDVLCLASHWEDAWGKTGSSDIPEKWRLLAILNMAVLDYDRWDFAVSLDNEYPLYYRISRNVLSEQYVLNSLKRWWDTHMLGDAEPSPGDSVNAGDYLRDRFPAELAPAQMADAAFESIGAELAGILAHIRAFEKRRLSLENLMKLKMGAHEAMIGQFGKVTWKRRRQDFFVNWQRLAEALLDAHYRGREQELLSAFSVMISGEREFHFVPRGNAEGGNGQ
jgi:predicted phage-related endonuclease